MTDDLAEKYRRHGTHEWRQAGSAYELHRYAVPVDGRSRRRCVCCKRRATHRGMANGICLLTACEWRVTQWVRDPASIYRALATQGQSK